MNKEIFILATRLGGRKGSRPNKYHSINLSHRPIAREPSVERAPLVTVRMRPFAVEYSMRVDRSAVILPPFGSRLRAAEQITAAGTTAEPVVIEPRPTGEPGGSTSGEALAPPRSSPSPSDLGRDEGYIQIGSSVPQGARVRLSCKTRPVGRAEGSGVRRGETLGRFQLQLAARSHLAPCKPAQIRAVRTRYLA
ncbi:hypothetical protein GQ53DRAFT_471252 [Thozetella sp. PMI_491]|nr:hypothetical protein GQ53DRAFT_471252 [Thozetella sp. PMI_491]